MRRWIILTQRSLWRLDVVGVQLRVVSVSKGCGGVCGIGVIISVGSIAGGSVCRGRCAIRGRRSAIACLWSAIAGLRGAITRGRGAIAGANIRSEQRVAVKEDDSKSQEPQNNCVWYQVDSVTGPCEI